MKYCEDDKSAKLRVLLCNRSLCLATTCCCCCCCCCLFVGDVGRDRGVAEGIRFTGLVGRDAADDDRRTGLVFLEREVATRTSTTSTPRMLQLLLVVDLNAETAIFSSSSSSSSSGLSVCLLSSYFFPQKKKIPMSCIHTHNNNNKRAKAKSRLLLPTSYYYRLSSRAKEKRSAISRSLSRWLAALCCSYCVLTRVGRVFQKHCTKLFCTNIGPNVKAARVPTMVFQNQRTVSSGSLNTPRSENRHFRLLEYSAVREPSFPAP